MFFFFSPKTHQNSLVVYWYKVGPKILGSYSTRKNVKMESNGFRSTLKLIQGLNDRCSHPQRGWIHERKQFLHNSNETAVLRYNAVHFLRPYYFVFFVCNFAFSFFSAHCVLHPDWLLTIVSRSHLCLLNRMGSVCQIYTNLQLGADFIFL